MALTSKAIRTAIKATTKTKKTTVKKVEENFTLDLLYTTFKKAMELGQAEYEYALEEGYRYDEDCSLQLLMNNWMAVYDDGGEELDSWNSVKDAVLGLRSFIADVELYILRKPETLYLSSINEKAIITEDCIEVGCKEVSFEDFEKLSALVAKVRASKAPAPVKKLAKTAKKTPKKKKGINPVIKKVQIGINK